VDLGCQRVGIGRDDRAGFQGLSGLVEVAQLLLPQTSEHERLAAIELVQERLFDFALACNS
jgi:hypothetical protein